MMAYTKIFIEL